MGKKWYKLYLANNEVILVYRTWVERWLSNNKYPKFRRDDNGRLITFPSEAHWVLYWEQVHKDDVSVVREELRMSEIGRLEERLRVLGEVQGEDK